MTASTDTGILITTEPPQQEFIEPITRHVPEFADWLPVSVRPLWQMVEQTPFLGGVIIAGLFFCTRPVYPWCGGAVPGQVGTWYRQPVR